jgi:hypothetical protein
MPKKVTAALFVKIKMGTVCDQQECIPTEDPLQLSKNKEGPFMLT